MKVFLAGHEGSKKVIPACSYLLNKYAPADWDIRFLNFGEPVGPLIVGEFVSLAQEQEGGVTSWSKYLLEHLKTVEDELVIFALDDYLLSGPVDAQVVKSLMEAIQTDPDVVCARLCQSGFYAPHEFDHYADGLIRLTPHAAYSSTTQYCIWRRAVLVELLGKVSTPWQFELDGSSLLNISSGRVIGSVVPAMTYPDESSLSAKWLRVRVQGLPGDVVDSMVELGLLERGSLC